MGGWLQATDSIAAEVRQCIRGFRRLAVRRQSTVIAACGALVLKADAGPNWTRRAWLGAAAALAATAACTRGDDRTIRFRATSREGEVGEGQHPAHWPVDGLSGPVRMWLYLPRGYLASNWRWPLVVFLHGSGERGSDLEKVTAHGPPKLAARGADYPFILASPQLDEGRRWETLALHTLLGALQAKLRVDPDRVIATGLSLGGHGVWHWAAAYPQELAAIAPVCGFGEPEDVCRARHVPVRAYHGGADTVVPLARQQACVDALRACGGTVDFIVYPGVGHDAWNAAYDDPALVPWLMAQTRRR